MPLRKALVGAFLSLCAFAQSGNLSVYLSSETTQPPLPMRIFKQELGAMLHPAGIRLDWHNLAGRDPALEHEDLVVVRMHGVCGRPQPARTPFAAQPLAFTHVDGERILPFIDIRCDVLGSLLGTEWAHRPEPLRSFHYGRALARVLAHELYHYRAQTKHHSSEGVSKAAFSVRDLLSETFSFDHTAVNRMRRATDTPDLPVTAQGEEASGR